MSVRDSPPLAPGLCSPLRRYLEQAEEFKESRAGICVLIDAPQALLSVVECLGLGDIGRFASVCKTLRGFCNTTDDVWMVCWGRPWAQGYLADIGLRDAREWYSTFKCALRWQLSYEKQPRQVDVSGLVKNQTVAVTVDGNRAATGAREGPDGCVCALLTVADPAVVLGLSNGEVRVVTASSATSFMLGYGSIRHIVRRHRRVYVASWSGAVHAIHLDTLDCSLLLKELPSPVYGLQFDGNTMLLCCGSSRLFAYRVTEEGGITAKGQELTGHTAAVTDFHLNKYQLASGSMDKTVRLWRREASPVTGEHLYQCVHVLSGHSGPVWTVQVRCSRVCFVVG
jgi:hypothetical protein